jgi:uncharacterized membrane protein YvbJ
MKECPNCSAKVHDDVVGCPECGGRWEADGSFTGQQTTVVEPLRDPLVTEMRASELRREVRWGTFQGYLLSAAVLMAIYLVFMLAIVGCAGASAFSE